MTLADDTAVDRLTAGIPDEGRVGDDHRVVDPGSHRPSRDTWDTPTTTAEVERAWMPQLPHEGTEPRICVSRNVGECAVTRRTAPQRQNRWAVQPPQRERRDPRLDDRQAGRGLTSQIRGGVGNGVVGANDCEHVQVMMRTLAWAQLPPSAAWTATTPSLLLASQSASERGTESRSAIV